MFDLYYLGPKPNLFPHERPAKSLEDARQQSRTKFFWLVNGKNDLREFNFMWLPPKWEEHQTHIFLLQSQFEQFDVTFAPKENHPLVEHYYDRQFLPRNTYAENWAILKPEAQWCIDPTWVPNPHENPYIYVFGNPWYSAEEMPTVEYRVPGATEYKYVNDPIITVAVDQSCWVKLKPEANWIVDPAWAPNPFEPPYIYVFGNPWYSAVEMPTMEYRLPGAIEYKYVDEVSVTVKPDSTCWHILKTEANWIIDEKWMPNPFEPPYIYVFGNPWYSAEEMPTIEYRVPGASEYKYVSDMAVSLKADTTCWKILKTEANWIIDEKWMPNPFEPPYIYVFGNPWYSSVEMPTAEYIVPGATEYKYVDELVLSVKPTASYFKAVTDNVDIATLAKWAPNPFDPPYIYVFGNQWYPAEEMATVEYIVPGATERKYVDEPRAKLLPTKKNWTVPEEVNASLVDFSWVPHPKDPPFIYHFGSEFQMSVGLTYTVPDATELKFAGEPPTLTEAIKVVQTVNMFFVDMNNKSASARYESLKLRYPEIQKIRFMNGWIETIKRCATRSTTGKFWVISSENVYDDFNFEWHAQPWQTFMTHVFGSQWQKWSDTFLIGKNEFARHAKWAKSLEQFPNLNFVKDQKVYRPDDIYDIFYVDHFNPGSNAVCEQIQKRYPDLKKARYVDNYLDTFKRIVATAETDYIWVINSICDYSKFDFTWQPEPWQAKMLHVFPSDDQKFGDTFYVHVQSFKEQMDKLELLDWFDTVNYCSDQTVPRLAIDVVNYDGDTVVDAVKAHNFTGPFAMFKHNSVATTRASFAPSIWRKKDRVIHVLSKSGSVLVVPRESKEYLDTQMYDYPYILPHKEQFIADKCLDIVYISNGEPDAERWYNHLQTVVSDAKMCNRLHWVKDIKGRSEAYKAAANVSTTPWFFTVFAKLEINPEFDWNWQPDYMQEPKHYIFNALNPVNGLVYGHQGLICYNKNLVLSTNNPGLDFTLSKAHEVVDLMSGTAHYNVDPIVTWRTAFRECIKLCAATDDDSAKRLLTWSTIAQGKNAEWSINGAKDAREYYDSVAGDQAKLMLSFEWAWLNEYFSKKYP